MLQKGYYLTPIRTIAQQDLSAAILNESYTMTKDGELDFVAITFDGAVTETVVVTIDSVSGAAYDWIVKSSALSGATTFFYQPSRPVTLKKGDIIKVTCTQATATETASLTISAMEVETWIS